MEDKRIKKFRKLADNMQDSIDSKLCPATASQNLTPRRARIIASMRADGERLQTVQSVLRGIAEDLENSKQPIVDARSKSEIEDWVRNHLSKFDRYMTKPNKEDIEKRKMQEIEYSLLGCDIPGFFPTPKNVIERMVELADIKTKNPLILEPSAGKGDILDYVKERIQPAGFLAYEINSQLVEILKSKGYYSYAYDFLDEKPIIVDYALMNPPFEKFADIHHVKHAYKFLKHGGRLVSIMSEGVFFRTNKICEDFRNFVESCGYSEKLEPGSFKSAFRTTGVSCRIVVLNK